MLDVSESVLQKSSFDYFRIFVFKLCLFVSYYGIKKMFLVQLKIIFWEEVICYKIRMSQAVENNSMCKAEIEQLVMCA